MWQGLQQLKRTEGQVIVMVAAAMTAILGLTATVVDVAALYVATQRLQDTVDFAALAAGQDLPDTARATTTANAYLARNGVTAGATVVFPDLQTVTVAASSTVDFTFARVFGMSSSAVHVTGSAAGGQMGQAFDYTLFSGSNTATLTLNGSSSYIGGKSHSNKNFTANGSTLTITGACEAVGSITINGSQINIPQRIPNAPYVPMPDFAETIKARAKQAGTYFVGNKTYNGSVITVDAPIYVEGNLTINGSRFTGAGTIVATGTLIFNGSSQRVTGTDALAFYSKSSNITVNGAATTIDGILYAPNGQVTMNGSNQTVRGRVIGNTVTINGSQLTVTSSNDDLRALPTKGVKLVR